MTLPRWPSVAALYALQNSMMLTPCWPSAGPTGGAGLASPALIWSLISPTAFFFGGMSVGVPFYFRTPQRDRPLRRPTPYLNLRDLGEAQFDRCFAAEDGHQHLEFLLFGVDLVDRRRQRGERSVHDGDRFADGVVDLDHRTLQLNPGARGARGALDGLLGRTLRKQELDHVVEHECRGARRRADESGDARGVTHRGPRVVGQVHPHQDVARQHLAVDLLALAVLDLGDLFGGDFHLEDVVADVQVLHTRLEIGFHLVLVTGVGVDDVPVTWLGAQVGLQRGGRVDLFGLSRFLGCYVFSGRFGRDVGHRLGAGRLRCIV